MTMDFNQEFAAAQGNEVSLAELIRLELAEIHKKQREVRQLLEELPKLEAREQKLVYMLNILTGNVEIPGKPATGEASKRGGKRGPRKASEGGPAPKVIKEVMFSESNMIEIAALLEDIGHPIKADMLYEMLLEKKMIQPVDSPAPIRTFAVKLAAANRAHSDLLLCDKKTHLWGTPDMFTAEGRRNLARRKAAEGEMRVISSSSIPVSSNSDPLAAGVPDPLSQRQPVANTEIPSEETPRPQYRDNGLYKIAKLS